MDWTQVLTVFAVIATNLGTVIALFCHSDRKIDENRRETNEILKGIQSEIKLIQLEMKEFHGKLEKQDAEFKAHLMYHHDERNKK